MAAPASTAAPSQVTSSTARAEAAAVVSNRARSEPARSDSSLARADSTGNALTAIGTASTA